jgi:hypothetical protein
MEIPGHYKRMISLFCSCVDINESVILVASVLAQELTQVIIDPDQIKNIFSTPSLQSSEIAPNVESLE